jgi:diguanylate cyclase (GGDEF)-like protein/PAS domain S-box-containing protein
MTTASRVSLVVTLALLVLSACLLVLWFQSRQGEDLPPVAGRAFGVDPMWLLVLAGVALLAMVLSAYTGVSDAQGTTLAVETEPQSLPATEEPQEVLVSDLVERNRQLLQSNQELGMRNRFLQEMGEGTSFREALLKLTLQIERLYPWLHATVYLFDSDQGCLRLGAAPSMSQHFSQTAELLQVGEGCGTLGTAAFRAQRVVTVDVHSDQSWRLMRDLAQQHDIRACWAQPIANQAGRLVGVFGVFLAQAVGPSEGEISLIESCAQMVGMAIDREQAQHDLRIAATTFESQEGKAVTDANRAYIKVNKAFTRITGYSAEEALGQTTMLLNSGLHDDDFYEQMRLSLENTGGWQGEIWHKRKNGEIYPEWLTVTSVRDDRGRVTNFVASFSDVSQRKAAEMEIESLAYFDPLTHLPNRRMLMDRLKQAVAGSERSQRQGALLLIDLDNFKTLNDTHGHDKGDLLLRQVAQRLNNCIRDEDTVARLGGDEFVVMLKDLSESRAEAAAQAEVVGEKILTALNEVYELPGLEHHSSASLGVTLFRGSRDGSDELLKRADLALYQAKAAGRNAMRFFEPEMQKAVTARAELEVELREALAQKQFVIFYQPQVDSDGQVSGVEALVRWKSPRRGLVYPVSFISLAEETGLILELGHWVLQQACRQLALWSQSPGTSHLTMAVNVSARQFHQRDFEEEVLELLDSSGAPANRLKLELTESLLASDIEEMVHKMASLKHWGVAFALDDFGTGYSSLSYLKRLPLDQLKIDQTFVRDSLTDPNDAVIAQTIIALGQSLGLSVIAEGVETVAQRDFLAASGCHHFQGYLYGRPMPIEELQPRLEKSVVAPVRAL